MSQKCHAIFMKFGMDYKENQYLCHVNSTFNTKPVVIYLLYVGQAELHICGRHWQLQIF